MAELAQKMQARSPELIGQYENRIPTEWLLALPAERAKIQLPDSLTTGYYAYEAYCENQLAVAEQQELAEERKPLGEEVVPDLIEENFRRRVGRPALAVLAAA